jgi:long-chain acyl-CoA synthetase
LQEAVDLANQMVSKAESVRSFKLLDTEFSVESGHLTPSLKLKRSAVVKEFQAEIAEIYG